MNHTVNTWNLLQLLDTKSADRTTGNDVAAYNAMLGEELVLQLFGKYIANEYSNFKLSHSSVSVYPLGAKRPKTLDASATYSVGGDSDREVLIEIKNWSAHSKPGYNLPPDADEVSRGKVSVDNYKKQILSKSNFEAKIEKVVYSRFRDNRDDHSERWLLMWMPICSNETVDGIASKCRIKEIRSEFNGGGLRDDQLSQSTFHLFSASNYIRSLHNHYRLESGKQQHSLDLDLSRYHRRKETLNSLYREIR